MTRPVEVATVITLLAVTFMCVCMGLAGLAARKTSIQTTTTVASIDTTVIGIGRAVELLRQHADKVLTEAGLTAREARLASGEQRVFWNNQLPLLTEKINTVLTSTNTTITDLDVVVKQSGTAIGGASDRIAELKPVIVHLDTSVKGLSDLVTDPDIKLAISHAATATGEFAGTATALKGTAQDIQVKVHKITNPSKKRVAIMDVLQGISTSRDLIQLFSFLP